MRKSKVYLIRVSETDTAEEIKRKLKQLLATSGILGMIAKEEVVAVKLHFGEEGNTGFVRPEYAAVIVDKIKAQGAHPTLADTNTLYRGRRMVSAEHLELAYEHGFTPQAVGAQVVIADDHGEEVKIEGRFIKSAKVSAFFLHANAIVGIAHFKGHMMTGFGGALKNLGMGCATREGKLSQHSDFSPRIDKKNCIGCRDCAEACPVEAIMVKDKKAHLNSSQCIGCASCIAACKREAIYVEWEKGAGNIQEKMIEYAKAVLSAKKNKQAFINFAIKITKECDCLAKDDPRISPDIGLLASNDPLSIDQASLDLVMKACGRDIFKEAHPHRESLKQLRYAHKLSLGNLDYELIELNVMKGQG